MFTSLLGCSLLIYLITYSVTKLELGSQYQVATASEGLKIKIKKADGK